MDKTDLESFYDKQPDYNGFRNDPVKQDEYKILVDWKVRKLVRLVPADYVFNNVLEVGCAFGVLLNNISDRLNIKTRIGIDISGENIKVAEKMYPGCNFFQGTLEEYVSAKPLLSGNHKIDLIILSDIVEHVPDDLEFLKIINKISKYVLLNLPLEKSFKNRNRNYGENDTSGHLRCYNISLALNLIRRSGFEIISNFTSIATTDKLFFRIYKKIRSERVSAKPIILKLFWSVYYSIEDKFKLLNKSLTEKIYGTNYFALLKNTDPEI
jgi:SAM-dependent methyltransferase